jgi:iron complex outermembrane recepter protein
MIELAGEGVEEILRAQNLNVERAQYFTNALDTRTQGLDLTANWRLRAGEARWDLSGVVNWTRNRILTIREPPELQGTGALLFDPYLTGGTISLEKERPEWRSTLGVDWQRGLLRWQARMRYYGKHTTSQLGVCEACVQEISPNALVDLEVGYLLPGNLSLSVGAKNLLDTYPERLIPDNSFGIFLFPMASPFGYNGRYLYVRSEITLGR